MAVLTVEQLRAYAADGFVRLDGAFSRDLALRCQAVLWEQLDEARDDAATWTRPVVRLGRQTDPVFDAAATSRRWVEAIHEIVGPAAAPTPWMGGTIAARFPVDGDPGDDGWHIDGSYVGPDGGFWVNHRSDERALLMLVLLSDVGVDDAPTRIRVGSHHDIPDALLPYGDAGVSSLDLVLPERTHERALALATGRAGDVYLCHPFLVHAAQRHRGREPRFVAQPGVPWKPGERSRRSSTVSALVGPTVRERLLERVAKARVVLLEAPGGYGKTTLAEQCIDAWELGAVRTRFADSTDLPAAVGLLARAVRRAGLGDVAEAIGSVDDDPLAGVDAFISALADQSLELSIVLDDVHRLDPVAARELAHAFADLPARCRLIVAGRTLRAFADLAAAPSTTRLNADDLRMTAREVEALLGPAASPTLTDEVTTATTGWCAAVVLAVQRLRADPTWSPTSAGSARLLLDEMVGEIVGTHPDLARLAGVPLIDAAISDLIGGPALLPDAIAAGVVTPHQGSWFVVPDPIKESLERTRSIDLPVRVAIAEHYRTRGEIRAGLTMLTGVEDPRALAAFLAAMHWTELEALRTTDIVAVIDRLDDRALAVHPEVLTAASQAVELAAPEHRSGWLARALAIVEGTERAPIRRAAHAEQTRDLVAVARLDEAVALAHETLRDAEPDERATRGRALTTLARAEVFQCTPESLAEGARLYADAATQFDEVHEVRWRAEALARRGYTALYMAGYPHEGEAEMRAALALLPTGDFTRGFWLANYSDVLDYLGRVPEAEAAAHEALEIGTRRRDRTLIGMGWWSVGWIAAHRGDREAFHAAIEAFERHAGEWVRAGQLVEFLGSSADLLAALGDHDAYAAYIKRAREAATAIGYHTPIYMAEALYEARFGDPDRAIAALDLLDSSVAVVPSSRPLRAVLRSLAIARRGDLEHASSLLREAREAAAGMGVPDLLLRHAHSVLVQLEDLLNDTEVAEPPAASVVTMRLFGTFSIEVGGVDRTPQAGHPSAIVKLLALNGTMTTDAAIDALWPDADIATGRSRLRNLLNRVKQRSGDVVVRDGDLLRLHPDVSTDVGVFEARAASALSGSVDERVGSARHAIALYTGELLPADVYEDWTAGPRERAKRRYLTLTDLVADDAIERGDTDEAIRLLDLAIAVEPLDGSRYTRLCAVLVAQGRVGTAREVAARAVTTLAEIGEVVGPDLLELVGA